MTFSVTLRKTTKTCTHRYYSLLVEWFMPSHGLAWLGLAKNSFFLLFSFFFFLGKNDLLKVILNQNMNNWLPKQLKYLQNNFVMESGDYMKSQLV
jgi:hypothetical protein